MIRTKILYQLSIRAVNKEKINEMQEQDKMIRYSWLSSLVFCVSKPWQILKMTFIERTSVIDFIFQHKMITFKLHCFSSLCPKDYKNDDAETKIALHQAVPCYACSSTCTCARAWLLRQLTHIHSFRTVSYSCQAKMAHHNSREGEISRERYSH